MSGFDVGVGGAWKAAKPFVGVGGAWKRVQAGWVGAGGVWKQFYTSLTVSIVSSGWRAEQDEVGNIIGWDASVSVDSITGGTAPYTYLWSDGSTESFGANLLTAPGGSFPSPVTTALTVTDATGATGSASVVTSL